MTVPDSPLDDSEKVQWEVRKVKFVGDIDHWFGQLKFLDEVVCEVTAPSFWGAVDAMMEYLTESDSAIDFKWMEEGKNGRNQRDSFD